jgi:eukaryotic-like serine/threonine-protein kinase
MHSPVAVDPRFELVDELGRGGMGVVYRARDRQRGGEVALKALHEVGPSELLRLKREFRVMCNVRHPNLVRLGELVEHGGGWFFTMELVEGVDLLEWVKAPDPPRPERSSAQRPSSQVTGLVTTAEPLAARASRRLHSNDKTEPLREDRSRIAQAAPPLPHLRPAPSFDEPRLRAALRGVTEGLAGLHGAGLVHRDVKPSNIKVDRGGRVVLLDFGVTISLGDADNEIAGTYAYMAPEQAEGQATSASDWYAVGIMLFRAMTGHLPFPPTRAGLAMKGRAPAPSPDEFVRDLPQDLVSLCQRLMATQPADRAGEAAVRAAIGHALPLRTPTASIAPFVGRRTERERLAAIAARQRQERDCRVVLILGASGVGKTALARRFLDDHFSSQQHCLVLESRCDERETVPFNALDGIVDGLARIVARHPDRLPEQALDVLRSADAAELCRLFPVLAKLAPPRRLRASFDDSRSAATRALREILAAIGRATPLALLIDDAQWADADSGVLLADLLAQPAPSLLLVVTARGPDAPPLVATLPQVEQLALGGLDLEDAIQLATSVAANAQVDAAAIVREAEGHPMFVAELTRFAAERRASAGSLDDALWARACDLPQATRRLLHVVVTDTAALPRSLAVAAAGLEPDEAAAALAELRAARLVRVGEDVIEPYHDRVREALVGRLPRTERVALHDTLARALEASGAPPERLAHHWAGAGEAELAARCAEAAATRAGEALAFERAAEWLAMSLALGTHDDARRRELLVARGNALAHAGHLRDAGLAFLEASRTGEPADVEQRDLRRRAAEHLLAGGYSIEGLEIARQLLAEVGLSWPASRAAALRALLWSDIRIATSRLRWRSRSEAELSPEQKLRLDTCWSTAVGLSMLDSMRGTTFAFRALLMNLAAGEPRRIANALSGAAFAAAGMNQHRRLRRLTKAIARAAAETDAPEARCYLALAESARAYFVDNDWPATRDIALRGLDVWAEAGRGHTWEVDLLEQFVGWGHATGGDYRPAADHAARVLRGARRRGDRFIEVGFRVQFPHQYLLEDQPLDGIKDVDDALASWPVPDGLEQISNPFYWAWRSRVMLALYAGQSDTDAAWVEEGRRRIERSLLWKVPAIRLDVSMTAGMWSVARAVAEQRTNPSIARTHVADVHRRVKVIAASQLPAHRGLVASFHAVLAYLAGKETRAIEQFRIAIAFYDQHHTPGPATAARWRLGQLVGGDEGATFVEQAHAWYRAAGAARPERIVACAMPGISTS